MANQWFRLYAEFVTDPKVQMLSEQDQRRYIMVLCLRCSNGDVTLQDGEVAFQLRISNEEWLKSKSTFMEKNLTDDNNRPVAWDVRQYVSDSSNERVKRLRQRRKDAGLSAQSNIKKSVREAVLEECGNACVYCGSKEDLTIDHKTPVERGGNESKDNLQVACRPCNADKRNMTHDEYSSWNGRVTLQKRHQNTDTDTDTDTEKTKTTRAPRFDARAHLSSLGVPDQIAIDWIAHRRAKRATPTRTAIDRIAKEAVAAGLSLGDALGMCCERGWMGFRAYWLLDQHPAGQRRQTVTETRTETVATLTGRIRHANQLEERDITPGLLRIAK